MNSLIKPVVDKFYSSVDVVRDIYHKQKQQLYEKEYMYCFVGTRKDNGTSRITSCYPDTDYHKSRYDYKIGYDAPPLEFYKIEFCKYTPNFVRPFYYKSKIDQSKRTNKSS